MSDDVASRMEAILAAKEKELADAKSKKTMVGDVMRNGGGAAAGAYVGWTVGSALAVPLAPFTFGLSALIPVAGAIAAGVYGHNKSKEID